MHVLKKWYIANNGFTDLMKIALSNPSSVKSNLFSFFKLVVSSNFINNFKKKLLLNIQTNNLFIFLVNFFKDVI